MSIKRLIIFTIFVITILSAYNQSQAILQAKLSVITHCTNAQIQNWSCALCGTYPHITKASVIENTATNIRGFIGYDATRNTIHVAWRGTEDYINWIEDADFKMVDYQGPIRCTGCKVHQGFYNSYTSVQTKVLDKVKQLVTLYPTAQITVTGHSLGGALAAIGTLNLYKTYPTKINTLYLFGCPRVGNSAFASYIHSLIPNIYRVIHYKDLVPHLPPHDLQYLHPPFQIFYDQTMKNYIVCNDSGEDPKCSNSLAPAYSTSDHTTYWFKTDKSIC